jgi:alpha,alpha-trehalose phosphorylase
MRDHDGTLAFSPKLPTALVRLNFRLVFRGRRFLVDVRHGEATYTLLEGDALKLAHHGEMLTVSPGAPVTRAIPPPPRRRRPKQPQGREPARRHPQSGT